MSSIRSNLASLPPILILSFQYCSWSEAGETIYFNAREWNIRNYSYGSCFKVLKMIQSFSLIYPGNSIHVSLWIKLVSESVKVLHIIYIHAYISESPQISDSLNASSFETSLFAIVVKLPDHEVAFNFLNTWEKPAAPAWTSDHVTYKSLLPSFSSTDQPKITSHQLSRKAINFLTFTLFTSNTDLQVF